MDILFEMLSSFTPDEEKHLEQYLASKSSFSDRIDKKLLKLLRQDKEPETELMIQQLYGLEDAHLFAKKRNAYYQWRSILSNLVDEFILLQATSEKTSHSAIKLTVIARFLFSRKKTKAALKYLQKAENLAISSSDLELLNSIYSLQIEYARVTPEIKIDELISKWRKNLELLNSAASLNAGLGELHYRIIVSHQSGQSVNIDNLINQILSQYNIDVEAASNDTRIRYKIASLVRTEFEEKGNFSKSAQYLEGTYIDLEKSNLFDKHNHQLKLELLLDLCRAAYKAKKYSICEKYLIVLKKEHELHNDYPFLIARQVMFEYVLYHVTNRLNKAAETILDFEKSHVKRIVQEDDYCFTATYANLFSACYYTNDLRKAKKYLSVLLNSEERILKYAGRIGIFCCQTLDCMLSIDAGNYDYTLLKIKAIRKRFNQFLNQDENKRYKLFLSILNHWCQYPDKKVGKSFDKLLTSFLSLEQPPAGNFEFVSFTPWVKSKLEKRSCYELFTEAMQ